jgi:hypothetical protein
MGISPRPRVAEVKKVRNLEVALPDEQLSRLWEEANYAIGRLMAGVVGRREWDDDVNELCGVVYDEICGNGFEANLYNAATMPLGLSPFCSSTGWREALAWVWDPDEFSAIADAVRYELQSEGWTPPPHLQRSLPSKA